MFSSFGGGGGQGFGQLPYMQSNITPMSPITRDMTAGSTSQGTAGIYRSIYGDPRKAIGFNSNRGVSYGPAQMARFGGVAAQGNAAAHAFGANQQLSDANTNASSLLAGQSARDQSTNGMSAIYNAQQNQNWGQGFQQQNNGLSLLQMLLGGY